MDTLWAYRDADHLIDDEFMRYFRFVCDICSWHDGRLLDDKISIDALAEQLYGAGNQNTGQHLQFLISTLDIWEARDTRAEFSKLFIAESSQNSTAYCCSTLCVRK